MTAQPTSVSVPTSPTNPPDPTATVESVTPTSAAASAQSQAQTQSKSNTRNFVFYLLGLIGHDVFYFGFSLYLIKFITGPLFASGSKSYDDHMVALISGIIIVVRIVELVLDPFLGTLIDNTRTPIGKFKPWIISGGLVGSISFVMLFTTFGGANINNPVLYVVLFTVFFLLMDCSYSLYDISMWSMIPALSDTAEGRGTATAVGRLGAGVGQMIVTAMVIPSVLLGEGWFGSERHGWLFFAVLVFLFVASSVLLTSFGIKEVESPLRAHAEKTKFKDVFRIIFHNDQLAWLSVASLCYYFALALTAALMTYYFQYIYGDAASYSMIFGPATLSAVVSIAFYPWLISKFERKPILFGALGVMLVSFVVFFLAPTSVVVIVVASVLFLFPQPIIWASLTLALTDTIEYGQWKTGERHESLTLALRPMLDKFSGALSNGIVGLVAVACGMTGAATFADITPGGRFLFKAIMCGVPVVLVLLSMLVYHCKFTLTMARHEQIVKELTEGLSQDEGQLDGSSRSDTAQV
ncbi:glycoside-pentoside-hexuronide (GPH):cation symporter [Bifidobacterium callimiconis]|uniref:PTS sugar transporter subunit IIA n=1 Tax=Bifidobacterium callimiconis TaxID=2306973 RepID=A0A430FBH6_9BIFI|nr:glycoside-pentoside-hexuronide (GPH):cation symporter [Bifidobacterium callimiconis]RSX50180.1 PTS sugar transporter subunit IIA [Bifidobacterium callimiconis]